MQTTTAMNWKLHALVTLLVTSVACGNLTQLAPNRTRHGATAGADDFEFDGGGPYAPALISDIPFNAVSNGGSISTGPIILPADAKETGRVSSASGDLPAAPSLHLDAPPAAAPPPPASSTSDVGGGGGGFDPGQPIPPLNPAPPAPSPEAAPPPVDSGRPVLGASGTKPLDAPSLPAMPNVDPGTVPSFPVPSAVESIPTPAISPGALLVAAAMGQANAAIMNEVSAFTGRHRDGLSQGRNARDKARPPAPSMLAPKNYPFSTALDSPNGQRLAAAFVYQNAVQQLATPPYSWAGGRQHLAAVAEASLVAADQALKASKADIAEFSLCLANWTLDAAAGSFGPLTKDTYAALNGLNPETGSIVSSQMRGAAMVITAGEIATEVTITVGGVMTVGVGLGVIVGIIYAVEHSSDVIAAVQAAADQAAAVLEAAEKAGAKGLDEIEKIAHGVVTPPVGDLLTGDGIDSTDTRTWPSPPFDGPFKDGAPSRNKNRLRGEKNLFDSKGGEWRVHTPDSKHPNGTGHWDYKPAGNNTRWVNLDQAGKEIEHAN